MCEATLSPPTPACRCAQKRPCLCLIQLHAVVGSYMQFSPVFGNQTSPSATHTGLPYSSTPPNADGGQEVIFCSRSSLTNCHYAAGSNQSKQSNRQEFIEWRDIAVHKGGRKIQEADRKKALQLLQWGGAELDKEPACVGFVYVCSC